MEEHNKSKVLLDNTYIIVFGAVIGFLVFALTGMTQAILQDNGNSMKLVLSLLPAISIMLSAVLASLSVLKSINSNKIIDIEKKEREEKEIKIRLETQLRDILFVINAKRKNEDILTHKILLSIIKHNIDNIEKDKEIIGKYGNTDLREILYSFRIIRIRIYDYESTYKPGEGYNHFNKILDKITSLTKDLKLDIPIP